MERMEPFPCSPLPSLAYMGCLVRLQPLLDIGFHQARVKMFIVLYFSAWEATTEPTHIDALAIIVLSINPNILD
jgi:hypothetical protein